MKIKGFSMVSVAIFLILISVTSCSNNEEKMSTKGTSPTSSSKKIGIMTYVSHEILDTILAGIESELNSLGYKKNQIVIYNANGEMDKVHSFAKEMVSSGFDILIPITTPVSQAVVKEAHGQTPVVYSFVSDPKSVGVKSNNDRPNNVTGISDIINYQSNLNLIKSVVPSAKYIGMIYNSGESNSILGINECRELAPKYGFILEEASVVSTAEVLTAARLIVDKIDAFYVIGDNTVVGAISSVIKVGREKNIPVFASDSGSVKEGACAAYSVDYKKFGKVTAELADRILKGENINSIDPLMYQGDSLVINNSCLENFKLSLPNELKNKVHEAY